ncbi:hypothetical protein [Serratia ficaria]|uniref:hypothetical protein n=1 Tax=Serratia ficaria TaxID=61651 RepID=UPI0021B81460|nr:hypothetical protein [Serratia ficaria]
MSHISIKKGATRIVFLIGKYVFKIPRFYSWRHFLNGLLSNMQEVEFSTLNDELLVPILFYLPLGLCVVMPRCKVYQPGSLSAAIVLAAWERRARLGDCHDYSMVERKHDSIGIYRGRFVAVDYGS